MRLTVHKAVMPKTASALAEAELSPDGKQVAVFVQYTYLSPLETLIARYLPGKIHPHEKVASG